MPLGDQLLHPRQIRKTIVQILVFLSRERMKSSSETASDAYFVNGIAAGHSGTDDQVTQTK